MCSGTSKLYDKIIKIPSKSHETIPHQSAYCIQLTTVNDNNHFILVDLKMLTVCKSIVSLSHESIFYACNNSKIEWKLFAGFGALYYTVITVNAKNCCSGYWSGLFSNKRDSRESELVHVYTVNAEIGVTGFGAAFFKNRSVNHIFLLKCFTYSVYIK
jgi:hypothetical protein